MAFSWIDILPLHRSVRARFNEVRACLNPSAVAPSWDLNLTAPWLSALSIADTPATAGDINGLRRVIYSRSAPRYTGVRPTCTASPIEAPTAQTRSDVTDNPVRTSRAARAVQPGQPGRSHEANAGSGLSIAPCLQTPLRRPDVVQPVATPKCIAPGSIPMPPSEPSGRLDPDTQYALEALEELRIR